MIDFYEQLLDSEQGKITPALRQAKLAMIARGGDYAHPYHWAPFVLIGK